MALHITELSYLANTEQGDSLLAFSADCVTSTQAVVTSAGSTQSNAFYTPPFVGAPGANQGLNGVNNGAVNLPATKWLSVYAGAPCSIAIGANPVAVTGGWFIGSSERVLIKVTAGQKLAVIADTP